MRPDASRGQWRLADEMAARLALGAFRAILLVRDPVANAWPWVHGDRRRRTRR